MIIIGLRDRIRTRMGRDAIWTFSSQIVVMLCLLLLNKILSNTLSVEEFGQYNVIRRSSAVLSFVILGGMGISLPRYLPYFQGKFEYNSMRYTILSSLVILIITFAVVLLICMLWEPALSTLIIGEEDRVLYHIVILYSLGSAACSLVYAYYRGMSQFKAFNISQIGFQVLITLPVILFMSMKITTIFEWWTILSILFAMTLFIFEYYRYRSILFKHLRIKTFIDNFKIITSYSFPRLIGDFLLFSLNAFPLIYLGSAEGLSFASYYSVGVSLVTIVSPVFSILGVILLPYVAKLVAANQLHDAARTIRKLLIGYMVVSIFLTIVFYAFMPLFIQFFFSSEYISTTSCSRVLILSILPSSIYYLYRNPIDAASVTPYNTFILLICLMLMVGLFLLSDDMIDYAWAFLVVMSVKGSCSILVWQFILKKRKKL